MTAPERDEMELASAAVRGDASAFEALLAAYQHRAWCVAIRMLGNAPDAQDAVQDAFLAAWRAIDRFHPHQPFGPWIVTIVAHRCLNVLRGRKRVSFEPLEAPQRFLSADATSDPEAAVERNERSAVLRAAMRHLSPAATAIVVLHYAEDMTCARIGDVLGMAESAVKVALFRARARLRDIMRGNGDDAM